MEKRRENKKIRKFNLHTIEKGKRLSRRRKRFEKAMA